MASNMILNHLIVISSHIGVYVTKDDTKKFVSFVKLNVHTHFNYEAQHKIQD